MLKRYGAPILLVAIIVFVVFVVVGCLCYIVNIVNEHNVTAFQTFSFYFTVLCGLATTYWMTANGEKHDI